MSMDSEKALNRVAVFATGYAKRFMEAHYDRLFSGGLGARLQGMQHHEKLLVEAVLYGVMTLAEERYSERGPLGKFLKSILMDAAPEIAKRIMNDLPDALDQAELWETAASAGPAWRARQEQPSRMAEALRAYRAPIREHILTLQQNRRPNS